MEGNTRGSCCFELWESTTRQMGMGTSGKAMEVSKPIWKCQNFCWKKKKASRRSHFLGATLLPTLLPLAKAVGFPGAITSHESDKKSSHAAPAKPPQAKPCQADGLCCRRSSRASLTLFVTCLGQQRGNGGVRGCPNQNISKGREGSSHFLRCSRSFTCINIWLSIGCSLLQGIRP